MIQVSLSSSNVIEVITKKCRSGAIHDEPYDKYTRYKGHVLLGVPYSRKKVTMYRPSLIYGIRLYSTKSAQNRKMIDRIIRVDHAGELGADRIYAGQMAVLGKTSVGPVIQHMWDQEKEHKAKFEELIPKYRVRPTVLLPIWNVAGYALGAGTALIGKEAAMACTVAVESVITDHYNSQLRELISLDEEENKELIDVIKKFRDDEMEHHDTGLEHDAELAPAYSALSNVVKTGCKVAVWLSERI